jgi:hypothetical protein
LQTGGAAVKYQYEAHILWTQEAFNSEVNKLARDGWELVNATFYGTVFYAFMRREISN